MQAVYIETQQQLSERIRATLKKVRVMDMHTHLFPPAYKDLCLCGMDDLLTYHYLVAEALRQNNISYHTFWSLLKREQAEIVWNTLFVDTSPLSEAAQGVLTILQALGVDYSGRNLNDIRRQVDDIIAQADYIDRVLELAQVRHLVMTNDPLNPVERGYLEMAPSHSRFLHSIRLDTLAANWANAVIQLNNLGYDIESELTPKTIAGLTRFLKEWIQRLQPVYLAISFPPSFRFPEDTHAARLLRYVFLPVCREHDLPLGLMLGARRNVNPELKLAGDAVGLSSIESLGNLCAEYPEIRFLITVLSRENQHELTVMARKFRNIMLFGCWWYLNTPLFIGELTRMRFELLGTSFIPQHSDCRVLEQLIYKWRHTFQILEKILTEKYGSLLDKGWIVTEQEVERDINKLFNENFQYFSSPNKRA